MRFMYMSILILLHALCEGLQTSVRYLETNCWLWDVGTCRLLVDPVLSSPLEFGGISALYSAEKRTIKDGLKLLRAIASSVDCVLISQGFEDHAHLPTLKDLASLRPDLKYVCPASAVSTLKAAGIDARFINPLKISERIKVSGGDTEIDIEATSGALLGPPWQEKENGYILRPSEQSKTKFPSIYYEPHCMFDAAELARKEAVDYVITPVVRIQLPLATTLVDGGDKAIELAKILRARCIVPMNNGEADQTGFLANLLQTMGTEREFIERTKAKNIPIKVMSIEPDKVYNLL